MTHWPFFIQWYLHTLDSNMGVPGDSVVENPPANSGDSSVIPGLGRSPGEGNGNPLEYFCLGNPTDSRVWQATVYEVAKHRTQLSDRA